MNAVKMSEVGARQPMRVFQCTWIIPWPFPMNSEAPFDFLMSVETTERL